MSPDDARFGCDMAESAGRVLQEFRREFRVPAGEDLRWAAMQLRDDADALSQAHLAAMLDERGTGDAVLSEEAADSAERDTADRVWIIDPLDGTWEYGMGRSDWAVHIALWQRTEGAGGALVFGALAVPDEGLLLHSDQPPVLPELALDRPLRIIASRSRPPGYLAEVAAAMGRAWGELGGPPRAEVVQVGSVGAKVTRLLTGRAEVYLHDSGFYEWDVAAPLAVAHAAGLVGTHINGKDIQFNRRPPYVTSLLVSRPEVSAALQSAVA